MVKCVHVTLKLIWMLSTCAYEKYVDILITSSNPNTSRKRPFTPLLFSPLSSLLSSLSCVIDSFKNFNLFCGSNGDPDAALEIGGLAPDARGGGLPPPVGGGSDDLHVHARP